jgi:hypothetical protein
MKSVALFVSLLSLASFIDAHPRSIKLEGRAAKRTRTSRWNTRSTNQSHAVDAVDVPLTDWIANTDLQVRKHSQDEMAKADQDRNIVVQHH